MHMYLLIYVQNTFGRVDNTLIALMHGGEKLDC